MQPRSPFEKPQDSFKAFRESLRPGVKLRQWLDWPPDVFALTSSFFRRTGVYRLGVSGLRGQKWPKSAEWAEEARWTAREWVTWLVGVRRTLPEGLRDVCTTIEGLEGEVSLDGLRSLGISDDNKKNADDLWDFCRSIWALHAYSDQASAAYGILAAPSQSRWSGPGRSRKQKVDPAPLHCLANLLLSTRGTLSRLPKHFGLVLPKLRTPQSGLTLRSFSHHLTFQESEVEVAWRSLPWINVDENAINLMLVPHPQRVESSWFKPVRDTFRHVRSFEYLPSGEDLDPKNVVRLLKKASHAVSRIHILVFPESALTPKELEGLQDALLREADLRTDQLPIIVAGVREERPGPECEDLNYLVLSCHFAGRWYELRQHKHHRWVLTEDQVKQYRLAGVLSTARNWREFTEIRQRRLTVLCPNGWLALCPLICEDLAQLEPVSEVIRGVGPTLVLALLLDGPQLPERWSGRYASVLADDPGSAVLTLTSLGMAERSRPPGTKVNRTVALWRDQVAGWKPLVMRKLDPTTTSDPDAMRAKILTIEAGWQEEFTADGRSDGENAAVFRFQGCIETRSMPEAKAGSRDVGEEDSPRKGAPATAHGMTRMKHLTVPTFVLDSVLDSAPEVADEMIDWARLAAGLGVSSGRTLEDVTSGDGLVARVRPARSIVRLLAKGRHPEPGPRGLGDALNEISRFLKEFPINDDEPPRVRWKDMVAQARKTVEGPCDEDAGLAGDVACGVLAAVHNRLAKARRKRTIMPDMEARRERAELLTEIEGILMRKERPTEPRPTAS